MPSKDFNPEVIKKIQEINRKIEAAGQMDHLAKKETSI